MLVKNILSGPPATADCCATIRAVARMMRDNDTGAVIILDHERLVGIVTDRDIVTRLSSPVSQAWEQPVASIMTPDPWTCHEDQNVADAAVIMADKQVRHLPVVNQARHVTGVLSLDDIAENYCESTAGETLGEIVERRKNSPVNTPRRR
ncbi:MAG: signal-transduction protein with cAMP-binding, CBS, and nucleotidyltransferase domain [Paracoccaceae bacterium]|jgi:signal-transduction protein with cAMP-binding, CBS, and nucleotidyltransferase domain